MRMEELSEFTAARDRPPNFKTLRGRELLAPKNGCDARLAGPFGLSTPARWPGIPLDPSFEEQKKIMLRCNGVFYACKDGAEARRFNRLLIDAGMIKNL
jgi:hypothetical protein